MSKVNLMARKINVYSMFFLHVHLKIYTVIIKSVVDVGMTQVQNGVLYIGYRGTHA